MEQKKVVRAYNTEEVKALNERFKHQIGVVQDMGLKGKPIFRGFSRDNKDRLQVKLDWVIEGKTYNKEYPACEDCIAEGRIGYMKFYRAKNKEGTETGKWFMVCMNRKAKHHKKKAKSRKTNSSIQISKAKFKKLAETNPQIAELLKALTI